MERLKLIGGGRVVLLVKCSQRIARNRRTRDLNLFCRGSLASSDNAHSALNRLILVVLHLKNCATKDL